MGESEWEQMLQWNKANKKQKILGEWIRQRNDECGLKNSAQNESPSHIHQHYAAFRLPNRRPFLRLHRNRRQATDGGAKGGSSPPRRLHPLVPSRRPRYLESNTFRTFVAIYIIMNPKQIKESLSPVCKKKKKLYQVLGASNVQRFYSTNYFPFLFFYFFPFYLWGLWWNKGFGMWFLKRVNYFMEIVENWYLLKGRVWHFEKFLFWVKIFGLGCFHGFSLSWVELWIFFFFWN